MRARAMLTLLLLAAGELAWLVFEPAGEAEAGQQGLGPLASLGRIQTGVEGGHFHIGAGIEIRQQVITLENEAEVLPAQGGELVPAEGGSVAPGHQIGPSLG